MPSAVIETSSCQDIKSAASLKTDFLKTDLLKKILFLLIYMGVGFLLGRIRLLSEISPFGPALIAACYMRGRPEMLAAAAGTCLGALLIPHDSLYIICVALLVCGALLAVGPGRRWVAVMVTACAYAVSALVFKTADFNVFMTTVLECLMALVMIYVISTLLQLTGGKKRTMLSTEETICLALGALALICSFGQLNVQSVYIADIVAMLLVICLAYAGGAALGAGVGLVSGMALCLVVSADLSMVAMLGVAGLAAGTLRRLKKPGAAMGFMLTVLMVTIALTEMPLWHLMLIETAAATLIFCVIPRKAFAFAGRFFDPKTRREFENSMHIRRFKELTVGRLKEVSQVFLQTGEMFARDAEDRLESGELSSVLALVAESTCKDCVFKKSCWDKDFLNTYGVLNRLLATYEKTGRIDENCLDPVFLKKCYNVKGVLAASENVFSTYLLSLKWRRKIDESRVVTGRQLKGVARVVADIGKEMDTGFTFLEQMEERIAAALDAENIRSREVCAETVAGQMAVGLKIKTGSMESTRGIEKMLSGVCGVRMQKVTETVSASGAYSLLRFEQARRFNVETGLAQQPKDKVSGDSSVFAGLKDGRHLMMVCDGMGSGENARRESESAVSLIENFYQAGFDDAIIFDTINRLLILKSDEDMFTTVDLCLMNLKTGDVTFTKIGAEPSYILNSEGVSAVAPGSLPIGIVDEVRPVSIHKTLVAGDLIVMMSDGVSAAVGDDAVRWFSDIPQDDAQMAADAILQKAIAISAVRDDMTVMVGKITEMS
jgi:stage II sporulation protein E